MLTTLYYVMLTAMCYVMLTTLCYVMLTALCYVMLKIQLMQLLAGIHVDAHVPHNVFSIVCNQDSSYGRLSIAGESLFCN